MSPKHTKHVISTGNETLNSILGGGWPVGPAQHKSSALAEPTVYPATRISEVYGSKGSGRTAIVCSTIAAALEAGKRVLLIDCAGSEIDWRAGLAGAMRRCCTESRQSQIKLADLCYDARTALSVLEHSKGYDLIVLCTASFRRNERTSPVSEAVSLDIRRLHNTLRKVASWQRNASLLIVSEQSNPAAVDFGRASTSSSGNSPKFYALVRLHVRRLGRTEAGTLAIKAKCVKNKQAAPFQDCELEICSGVLQP